jgi:hypothetical protein
MSIGTFVHRSCRELIPEYGFVNVNVAWRAGTYVKKGYRTSPLGWKSISGFLKRFTNSGSEYPEFDPGPYAELPGKSDRKTEVLSLLRLPVLFCRKIFGLVSERYQRRHFTMQKFNLVAKG